MEQISHLVNGNDDPSYKQLNLLLKKEEWWIQDPFEMLKKLTIRNSSNLWSTLEFLEGDNLIVSCPAVIVKKASFQLEEIMFFSKYLDEQSVELPFRCKATLNPDFSIHDGFRDDPGVNNIFLYEIDGFDYQTQCFQDDNLVMWRHRAVATYQYDKMKRLSDLT